MISLLSIINDLELSVDRGNARRGSYTNGVATRVATKFPHEASDAGRSFRSRSRRSLAASLHAARLPHWGQ